MAAHHGWLAALFIACVVTIFAGFLNHVAQMNLGTPHEAPPQTAACPWKLGAMIFVGGRHRGSRILAARAIVPIGGAGAANRRRNAMNHTAPFAVGYRMARQRLECGDLSPLSSDGNLGGGLNAFKNPRRTKSADKSAHSKTLRVFRRKPGER